MEYGRGKRFHKVKNQRVIRAYLYMININYYPIMQPLSIESTSFGQDAVQAGTVGFSKPKERVAVRAILCLTEVASVSIVASFIHDSIKIFPYPPSYGRADTDSRCTAAWPPGHLFAGEA